MILTAVIERFNINTAVTYLITIGSLIIDFISDNALMFTLFCCSFVVLACEILKKIKKTSKR